METPQERNKEPTHKGKLSNAQWFSDLHPIDEESPKDALKSTKEKSLSAHKEESWRGETAKKIQKAVLKNRRLGMYKASSYILDPEDCNLTKNNLTHRTSRTKFQINSGEEPSSINVLPSSHIPQPCSTSGIKGSYFLTPSWTSNPSSQGRHCSLQLASAM
jgi:hypothetical protein